MTMSVTEQLAHLRQALKHYADELGPQMGLVARAALTATSTAPSTKPTTALAIAKEDVVFRFWEGPHGGFEIRVASRGSTGFAEHALSHLKTLVRDGVHVSAEVFVPSRFTPRV
jgi:hypothetical protein